MTTPPPDDIRAWAKRVATETRAAQGLPPVATGAELDPLVRLMLQRTASAPAAPSRVDVPSDVASAARGGTGAARVHTRSVLGEVTDPRPERASASRRSTSTTRRAEA